MQKKHFKHTNARYNTEYQLDNHNLRTWQLRDLLHVAGTTLITLRKIIYNITIHKHIQQFINTFNNTFIDASKNLTVQSGMVKSSQFFRGWSTTRKGLCTLISLRGTACPSGVQRKQKEPYSEASTMPWQQKFYNWFHRSSLPPSYKWILGIYMRYILSFYVQCPDFKESWHKTVLKYWSMKTMMMELQKKACTLENAWRFCKTQTENNSWSYNGLSGMRIMGLTWSQKYRLLNWPQRDTQSHSAPCLLTPF